MRARLRGTSSLTCEAVCVCARCVSSWMRTCSRVRACGVCMCYRASVRVPTPPRVAKCRGRAGRQGAWPIGFPHASSGAVWPKALYALSGGWGLARVENWMPQGSGLAFCLSQPVKLLSETRDPLRSCFLWCLLRRAPTSRGRNGEVRGALRNGAPGRGDSVDAAAGDSCLPGASQWPR